MSNESPSTGLNIVSLLFPLVGLILYLVKKSESPIAANSYGKFALIGVGVTIALNIILSLFLY